MSTVTISFEEIKQQAIKQAWTNRKIKDAMFAAGMNDRRAELVAAVRAIHPVVEQPVVAVAPASVVAPVAVAPVVRASRFHQFIDVRTQGTMLQIEMLIDDADKAIKAAGLDMMKWDDVLAGAERRIGGLNKWTHPGTGEVRVYLNGAPRGVKIYWN